MRGTAYIFLFVLNVVQCYVPSVVYVSFLINETSSSKYNSINNTRIIETSDDTPLVEIKLPSLFPLFGEFVDHLFVSPNGYLQTSPVHVCYPGFCYPCNHDYFGKIAGILFDFNTFGNEEAYVSVQRDDIMNTTTVYYNQVNFYGYSNLWVDFGIRLYPDGTINILYDNVTHPDMLSLDLTQCTWLSGLIGHNMSQTQSFKVTKEQKNIQKSEWNARNAGVYPPSRAGVKSGSHYCLCPISTSWGCAPAVLDNTTEVLNVTTLSMSCIADTHDKNHSIQIAILFSSSTLETNESDVLLDTDFIAECDPVFSSVHESLEPSPMSFTCNLSNINMSSFLPLYTTGMEEASANASSVFVSILWKPSTTSSLLTNNTDTDTDVSSVLLDYRLIGSHAEIPPLLVNYSSHSDSDSVSVSGSVSECTLNGDVGFCSACEVVYSSGSLETTQQSDLTTCLSLECTLDDTLSTFETYHTSATFSSFSSVTSYQTLYMRPSCYNKSCESTFLYDFDRNVDCCLISDIDCMGLCNGTSVVGRDLRGWVECCNPNQPPDCLGYCGGSSRYDCMGDCAGSSVIDCSGVCNGTSVVDACGICGGGDTFLCPHVNISVDTGTNPLMDSNHHLLAEYDASNSQFVSKVPVIVTNTNNVSLNVSFSFPKHHVLPPFITLPTGVYQMNPYSIVSFDIISNISDLFTHQYENWAVNSIEIKYSRVPSHFSSDSYLIDLLPLTNNCSNLTEIDMCTVLPGCMFCLGLPERGEIRILSLSSQSQDNDKNDNNNDKNSDNDNVVPFHNAYRYDETSLEYQYYYGNTHTNENIINKNKNKNNQQDSPATTSSRRTITSPIPSESDSAVISYTITSTSRHIRSLYARIVPIYQDEILDEDILNNGYCSTGFSSDVACEEANHYFSSSSSSRPANRPIPPSSFKAVCIYIFCTFIFTMYTHFII